MSPNTLWQPVIHGSNFYVRLEHPETTFNVGQAFVVRHRLRRNVLDDTGSTARITRAIAELIPA